MRKNCFIFLLLLLSYSPSFAQVIQGKVTDEKTGEGIPYTSIGVIGTNMVTVTNETGDFELKVNSLPVNVRFNHVSYLIADVNFSVQEKTNIKLKQANITLNQVVITPKNAEKLLVSALKYAKENSNQLTYTKGFYRQLTTVNNGPSEIYELFYDLKWSPENIKGWSAKKSRFATAEVNPNFSINNQSFLTFIFSGMLLPKESGKHISLETIKNYKISIKGYIEQKDRSIAIITCTIKSPSRKKMYVNSTYYIGTKNMHIYRIENELTNLPNNFKEVKDYKTVKPSVLTTISTFKANGDKIPVLESTATKLNISFISEKQPYHINVTSLLTVYQTDNRLKNQEFVSLDVNITDKKVIESIKYDADFWKNNPIVKRTNLETDFTKMMERKQAFGTMTNP